MTTLFQKRILIFGATSAIAQEVARSLAAHSCRFVLVARNRQRLQSVASDLISRGASSADVMVTDLAELAGHDELVESAWSALGAADIAVLAHGLLGDQAAAQSDFQAARNILETNFISAASLITLLVNKFEHQGFGSLVVLGSVAGDRGRKSNYVYGSSKAALDCFLAGIRHRLHGSGIQVLTVKPGLVDTPMTAHLPKSRLFARSEVVGRKIVSAIQKGKRTAYVPSYWRPVMMLIRHLPEPIFNRLEI